MTVGPIELFTSIWNKVIKEKLWVYGLEQVEPFLLPSQSLLRWSLEMAPLLQLSFLDYGIHKEARFL